MEISETKGTYFYNIYIYIYALETEGYILL